MTGLFLFLIGFTIFVGIENDCASLMVQATLLTAVATFVADWTLHHGGVRLAQFLHTRGFATGAKHPLASAKSLAKFREQGLQFVAHVVFALIEFYIISTESW